MKEWGEVVLGAEQQDKVFESMEGCLLQVRKDYAPAVKDLVQEFWEQDNRAKVLRAWTESMEAVCCKTARTMRRL
jgi:hypothetical protein